MGNVNISAASKIINLNIGYIQPPTMAVNNQIAKLIVKIK
jgi:hypothetical protein